MECPDKNDESNRAQWPEGGGVRNAPKYIDVICERSHVTPRVNQIATAELKKSAAKPFHKSGCARGIRMSVMFYVLYGVSSDMKKHRTDVDRTRERLLVFSISVVDLTGCTHKGSYKVTMDDNVDELCV